MMISKNTRQSVAWTLLGLLLVSPWQAEAKGEGQKMLLARGSLIADELDSRASLGRTLFDRIDSKNTINPETEEADYKRYIEMIKQLSVDVVAPEKGLMHVMNTVSTRFISHLLADYDEKFAKMNIGSVKRPMLKAYLAVRLSSQEDIRRWSKLRGARNISGSCESLLEKREQLLREQFGDTNHPKRLGLFKLIEQLRERDEDQHHLALLVFENNLNLFLLESFLALCDRIELEDDVREAFASYKSLL